MSNWWSGMTYSEWEEGERQRQEERAHQEEAQRVLDQKRASEPMYELIGRRVQRVLVNRDQSVLVFEVDGERVAFEAATWKGDAWFADVTGLDELRGHVVRSCAYIEVEGEEDERSRGDVEDFYGVRLTTDAGTTDIVFRCSFEWMSYGGEIAGTVDPPSGLKELTGDEWSA